MKSLHRHFLVQPVLWYIPPIGIIQIILRKLLLSTLKWGDPLRFCLKTTTKLSPIHTHFVMNKNGMSSYHSKEMDDNCVFFMIITTTLFVNIKDTGNKTKLNQEYETREIHERIPM